MKELFDSLNRAFDEFKASNDQRLKQIEAKGAADPLLEQKVDKINASISDFEAKIQARVDEIEAKANRPGAGLTPEDKAAAEYKAQFDAFMRRGEIQAALSTASDPDGGYAVPPELDRTIIDLLLNDTPMRRMATVISVGTPNYTKLFNTRGTGSGWVGETDARPETATAVLKAITPYMGELYANPAVTQQMLEDAFFNVESWLTGEVQAEFGQQENLAFVSGDGVLKPKGILAYPTAATADASRAFGTLEHVISGAAADFATPSATVSPADAILTLIYSLKAQFRGKAMFCMNKSTLSKIRKFKEALAGQYIWQPGAAAGQPSTLFGYPIEECESCPDVAANALPMMFGDFKRGYTIVDRIGTSVLRDPYSNKPYVHFYTRKRVGGMLTDSQAIKLLKIAAA